MRFNRLVIAGALLGALGAGLLGVFVAQSGEPPEETEPMAEALVITRRLTPGMTAEELAEAVETRELPADAVPARTIGALSDVGSRVVVRPVGEGEVLTDDQLALPGPAEGGVVVREGYEAISVIADAAPGVAGYVTPGSRVNVYVALNQAVEREEDGEEQAPTAIADEELVVQLVHAQLEVLGVTRGDRAGGARPPSEEDSSDRMVLLLQAPPQDVPELIWAENAGMLWFTLAHPGDEAPATRRVGEPQLSPEARAQAIRRATSQRAERGDEPTEATRTDRSPTDDEEAN